MTREDGVAQILKGVQDYDEGVIPKLALDEIVKNTVKDVADTAWEAGVAFEDDEGDEDYEDEDDYFLTDDDYGDDDDDQ